jgi:hypothetical protein
VMASPLEIDKRIHDMRVLRSGHAIEIGGILYCMSASSGLTMRRP